MASEITDISDLVKKCKILLLDIEGTTTSISFVKDELFPYAEANVKGFLESQWENKDVKEAVAALRKLAIEDQDKNVEGAVTIPGEDAGKEEQIEGLVNSVKWQMSLDRKVGPLKKLQGLIWKQGYDKGDIKGHVYDDVAPALQLWRSIEGQKVYIYSSGSVQAQKLLFKRTVAGDLLPHIEGHFDTAVGAKQEAASYAAIAEKIGCKPEEILFLTDILKEAEAARSSGVQAALVSREGNAPLPDEATSSYPVLHSFEQLTVSNKRKPDPQGEEVPAKVPKTDIEGDVKTASEIEVNETTTETKPVSETVTLSETVAASETIADTASHDTEPEKMEVEEVPIVEAAAVTEKVETVTGIAEEPIMRVETTIEEVTCSNGAGDAPICDINPVIEENVEKTENNETEKMETESAENVETVDTAIEPKEPVLENIEEQSASVAVKTPSTTVTVQDVTNDEQCVTEGTEVVDDLVPLVEEPPTIEMEELKNVGDVLEKECDEILSKVQDVTNLDNIPVKSMLNTIAEETMDAENGENTNDIVESILDSEMELAVKPCEDIDVNTVQEITDTKADVTEENPDNVQPNLEEPRVKAGEKTADKIQDINKTAENVVKGNKITEDDVSDSYKDKEEKEVKNNSAEIVTEEVNKEKVGKNVSATTTEVTNGIVQESNPEPVDEKIEATESVVAPKSDAVVESTETKEVATEVPESKPDSKESPTELKDNKMESDESLAASVENAAETKEQIVEPVDIIVETKESIMEPVDSEMESTDSTAKQVENEKKCQDNTAEAVENKAETKGNVAEQVDNKMDSEDNTDQSVENKVELKESITNKLDNEMESEDNITEPVENQTETKESILEIADDKMESEESTPQQNKIEESVADDKAAVPESNVNNKDIKVTQESTIPEAKTESNKSATNDVDMESEATEKQVNGNTNGEPEVNQNGDASKEEELSARLSVGNGENDKEINGANGNGESAAVEKGQGDNNVETEKHDIKVKTVASEEPRTDPIEQPVEA